MWQDKHGAHILKLTSSQSVGTGKRIPTPYTSSEVDFFIGYCADNNSFYVVPCAVAYHGRRKELRIWATRNPLGTNRHHSFDASVYQDAFHLLACP